jgi:AcrR family transcriptional regulator
MNQLEEAILLATIDEGGKESVSRFSLSQVAAASGVSEFLIFKHFQDKNHLLLEAGEYLFEHFEESVKILEKKCHSFPELFSALIDDQIAHPSWNGFILHYSPLFSQLVREPKQQKYFQERLAGFGAGLCHDFNFSADPEFCFSISSLICREIFLFSALILSKAVVDTPAERNHQAELLLSGVSFTLKSPAKTT